MKKRVMAASAVVCTLCVISVVCLGQIKMNRLISKSALANVEALTCTENKPGTCGSTAWTGDSWATICNVAKCCAMDNYEWWDTEYKWWCCDSCGETTYCGSGN